MQINIVKNHRTILFVDARDPSSTFSERVNRLIESLNGDNIKVDVHVVRSGSGTIVEPSNGLGYAGLDAVDDFDVDKLRQVAADYGYDQVLFSLPA